MKTVNSPLKERNTAFSSSSSSLDSSFTSSTVFTTSTSSGSTIPGPGALSGKAILALGKFTLRGAEFVIIRRRLKLIASKFPLADAADVKGLERMYDDVLELSRQDMYPKAIRERAMQLLLVQIGMRQTRHIVNCLKKWPGIETRIFLSELVAILDPIRLSRGEVRCEARIKAYRNSQRAQENHSLGPFIDFCDHLAQSLTQQGVITLLEAGVLKHMLRLYVTNFRDPLAGTERGGNYRTSILQASCNSLLARLCDIREGLSTICGDPFFALWPTCPELSFTAYVQDRVEQRLMAWSATSREVILWRLHSTFDMTLDLTTFDESMMYDVCADLLEFSASETMDQEITIRALRSLHRVFTRSSSAAQLAIQRYLASRTSKHLTRVISRIVYQLSRVILPDASEAKIFFVEWDNKHFIIDAVPHFLHLFLNLAKVDEAFLTVILAADVLGLMRPFLEIELRGHPEIQITPHEGDFLTVYDPPDFALLALIKERGLENLLYDVPSEGNMKYAYVYRRNVVCRAFNVFLGRVDNRPCPEFWNSNWNDVQSGIGGPHDAALRDGT